MKSAREECGRACLPSEANGEQHDFGAMPTATALAEVALTMKSPAGRSAASYTGRRRFGARNRPSLESADMALKQLALWITQPSPADPVAQEHGEPPIDSLPEGVRKSLGLLRQLLPLISNFEPLFFRRPLHC